MNIAAIDLITRHVLRQLNERGSTFKNYIAALEFKNGEIPDSVTVMDQTPRILVCPVYNMINLNSYKGLHRVC